MRSVTLTTSQSLALDVIRVSAALIVAFGHLTQPKFSSGWPNLTFMARIAVAVFFVLSGFVIRYVTCRHPSTLGHYLGDRGSRIYSIAIPALVLTLATDSIARRVNPAFYSLWEPGYLHRFSSIVINLAFCGQLWNHITIPLSNSPFWSVNFEVAYYLLYGCWFYLKGPKRWLWVGAICLFFGPHVLYLSPLWIAGCLVHDALQGRATVDPAFRSFLRMFSACLLVICFAALAFHFRPALLPQIRFATLTRFLAAGGIKPGEYLIGLLWAYCFFALIRSVRNIFIAPAAPLVPIVRFISEGTFPIYLVHFPLYVVIAACIPYNPAHAVPKFVIFFGVVGLGILAGHPGNLFKKWLRSQRLPPFLQTYPVSPNTIASAPFSGQTKTPLCNVEEYHAND